jgi:hypothetical protein
VVGSCGGASGSRPSASNAARAEDSSSQSFRSVTAFWRMSLSHSTCEQLLSSSSAPTQMPICSSWFRPSPGFIWSSAAGRERGTCAALS